MKHWTYYRFCEAAALRLSLLDRIVKMSAYNKFVENALYGTDISNVLKKALRAEAHIYINKKEE